MKQQKFITRTLSVLLATFATVAIIASTPINAQAASGVDGFVERCYEVALGRGSDPDGFAFWTEKLSKCELTAYSLAYNFIFSDEYTAKNKSDEDFVEDLYSMFMDRASDDAGKKFWVNKLKNGANRKEVFAGFAVSPEFTDICSDYEIAPGYFNADIDINQLNNINNFVNRMYITTLGRGADAGGQKYWAEGLLSGKFTGADIAAFFIQSDEFQAKIMPNSEYMDILYLACMGREADPEGKAGWMEQMKELYMTRAEVFQAFIDSEEFTNICNSYGIKKGSYTPDPSKRYCYRDTMLYLEQFLEPIAGTDQYEVVKCIYYFYDSKEDPTKLTSYDVNTFGENKEYSIVYYPDGKEQMHCEYTYAEDGPMNLTGVSWLPDGTPNYHYENHWDPETNKWIGRTWYDDIEGKCEEEVVSSNNKCLIIISHYDSFDTEKDPYEVDYNYYKDEKHNELDEYEICTFNGNTEHKLSYSGDGTLEYIRDSTFKDIHSEDAPYNLTSTCWYADGTPYYHYENLWNFETGEYLGSNYYNDSDGTYEEERPTENGFITTFYDSPEKKVITQINIYDKDRKLIDTKYY